MEGRCIFSYQQFVLFAVDDDGRYLLVHKDEDGAQKSRNSCRQDCPPRVASYWIDQPTSVVSGRLEDHKMEEAMIQTKPRGANTKVPRLSSVPPYLEFVGHFQLLGGHSN